MDLQPLTSAVLDPELKGFVTTWNNVSRLADLAYFPVGAAADVATLASSTASWLIRAPTMFAVPDAVAMNTVVTSIASTPSLKDVQGAYDIARKAGLELVYVQVGALVGEGPAVNGLKTLSANQSKYVHDILGPVVDALSLGIEAAWAAVDASGVSIAPTTFHDFLGVAADIITASYLKVGATPDIVAWLFPPELTNFMVTVALSPWLKMVYIGRLIGGPSFYDSRYAELMVFQCIGSAMQTLHALEYASPNRVQDTVDKLSALSDSVSTLRSQIYVNQTDGTSMVDMYSKVADLSGQVRDNSVQLNASSSQFEMRRDRADNLNAAIVTEEARMRRKRTVFYLWTVAFVVTLLAAVALLVVGYPSAYLLQAGVALATITLFLAVQALSAWWSRR